MVDGQDELWLLLGPPEIPKGTIILTTARCSPSEVHGLLQVCICTACGQSYKHPDWSMPSLGCEVLVILVLTSIAKQSLAG